MSSRPAADAGNAEDVWYRSLTWGTILVVLAARLGYLASGYLDLIADEAYYWTWSRHLSYAYHTKGPVIAFLIRAGTALGGDSAFWVRASAPLLAAVGAGLAARLTAEIFHSMRAGCFAALLFSAVPLFAVGGVLMTPDTPMLTGWLAALYSVRRALYADGYRWWLAAGAALAWAILSKYGALFFLPLFLGFSAVTRAAHCRRGIVIIGSATLVALIPALIWNAQHDWLMLHHWWGRGAGTTGDWGLYPRKIANNWLAQAAAVSPVVFLGCLGVLAGLPRLYAALDRRDAALLTWMSAPLMAGFALHGLFREVEANWPAIGYLPLLCVLSGTMARSLPGRALGWARRSVTPGLVVAVLMTIFLHFPDVLPAIGVPLTTSLDPTARLKGWRQFGQAMRQRAEAQSDDPFLLGENHQVTSLLAFYAGRPTRTFCVPFGRRHNQFDFWEDARSQVGRNALFVTAHDVPAPPPLTEAFARVEKEPLLEIMHTGRRLRVFSVFRCSDFRGFRAPATE